MGTVQAALLAGGCTGLGSGHLSTAEDVTLLRGKFQRMLFLTATPFQLGHQELIRVVRSFDAIRWSSRRAPTRNRDQVQDEIQKLEAALDTNRLAGRRLDRLWGGIRSDMLGDLDVSAWWKRVEGEPKDAWETRLVEYVNDCHATRDKAQSLLRPWVIRHNRPPIVRFVAGSMQDSTNEGCEQHRIETARLLFSYSKIGAGRR